MAIRKLFPMYGSPAPRVVTLAGTITIGSSGAISAQTGSKLAGATVTQTGGKTGRYAVAFSRTFKRILSARADFVGPDDSAFPTTTGSTTKLRLLTTSGFSIQCVRSDTQADALPASGSIITWSALVATV
ncbi:MAG TPA: hypothetical protein VN449_11090 [Gaiellaceae bacterium]|nr:hypothetical protein [Gaiellaceae bacterium]